MQLALLVAQPQPGEEPIVPDVIEAEDSRIVKPEGCRAGRAVTRAGERHVWHRRLGSVVLAECKCRDDGAGRFGGSVLPKEKRRMAAAGAAGQLQGEEGREEGENGTLSLNGHWHHKAAVILHEKLVAAPCGVGSCDGGDRKGGETATVRRQSALEEALDQSGGLSVS